MEASRIFTNDNCVGCNLCISKCPCDEANVARMEALAAEILARARAAHPAIGDHGLEALLAGAGTIPPSLDPSWYAAP